MTDTLRPSGHATFEIRKPRSWVPAPLDARLRAWGPKTRLGDMVKACFEYLPAGLAIQLLDEMRMVIIGESSLSIQVVRASGEHEHWGTVSRKVVTDVGVAAIIDSFQGLATLSSFNYHGLGTGAGAESVTDTTLGAELTTQYLVDNTRATGIVSEPASNQYRTQATVTVDASITINEHGLFSQGSAPGGTLLDRSLTGGQALTSGDGLLAVYSLTIASGG